MQKTKNKTYSAEFKAAAVKQANESELPVSETARNLGVNVNTLKIIQRVQRRKNPCLSTSKFFITASGFIPKMGICRQLVLSHG
jgi:transposase-like protein